MKSCCEGEGDRVLLVLSQFLHLQKLLPVADLGGAAGNPGHRVNERYTKDFLVLIRRSLIVYSVCLMCKSSKFIIRGDYEKAGAIWTHDSIECCLGRPQTPRAPSVDPWQSSFQGISSKPNPQKVNEVVIHPVKWNYLHECVDI